MLGKVARTAWIKYRIVQEQDMRQYMRLYFTVASDFDSDPEIAALLSQPGRQPGDFAKAVAALPEASIARLKAKARRRATSAADTGAAYRAAWTSIVTVFDRTPLDSIYTSYFAGSFGSPTCAAGRC